MINKDSPYHTGERGIRRMPSGNYELRLPGKLQLSVGVYSSLEEAVELRDQILSGVCLLPQPRRYKYRPPFDEDEEGLGDDYNLLEEYTQYHNVSEGTRKGYASVIRAFQKGMSQTVTSLINKSIQEEEQAVTVRHSTLRVTLQQFIEYMVSNNFTPNTAKTYYSRLLTLLRFRLVTIPVVSTNIQWGRIFNATDTVDSATYYDIPTLEEISKVVSHVNCHQKALLLFMSSSGCASAETRSITVDTFISGLKHYGYGDTTLDTPRAYLESVKDLRDMIPLLRIIRQKNGKEYVGFCSPKASYFIVDELLSRENLEMEDKIFPYTSALIHGWFKKWNDVILGGRRVGKYRYFRSHSVRKFFASNIGLDSTLIHALEGRSRGAMSDIYIKVNPEELREKYIEALPRVDVPLDGETWSDGSTLTKTCVDTSAMSTVQVTNINNNDPNISSESCGGVVDGGLYIYVGRLEQRIIQLEEAVRQLRM